MWKYQTIMKDVSSIAILSMVRLWLAEKFVKKNTKNDKKKKCVSKCSSEWWKTAAEVPFPPQVPAIYHSTIPWEEEEDF